MSGGGPAAPAAEKPACTIVKQTKSRWWEVHDPTNELVCLTVYGKGAREVVRRLAPEAGTAIIHTVATGEITCCREIFQAA